MRGFFFFPVSTRPILLQHFFAPYFRSSVCKCLPTRLVFLLHTLLFRKLKYDLITIQRRVPKRAHFKVDLKVRNVWHFDRLVVQPEKKSIFLPLSDDVFLHDCFSERISLIKHICSENNNSPSNHKIGNDVPVLQKFGFAVNDLDYGGFFFFQFSWIYHSTPLWFLPVACPPCLYPTSFAAADLSFPASAQLRLQILQIVRKTVETRRAA